MAVLREKETKTWILHTQKYFCLLWKKMNAKWRMYMTVIRMFFHMFRCNEIQLQIHARDRPVADARSWSFQKPLQKFCAGISNWRKADKKKKSRVVQNFRGRTEHLVSQWPETRAWKRKKRGPGGFRIIIKQRKNTRNDNNMVVGPQNDFMPQVQFFCPRSRQNPESFPA